MKSDGLFKKIIFFRHLVLKILNSIIENVLFILYCRIKRKNKIVTFLKIFGKETEHIFEY